MKRALLATDASPASLRAAKLLGDMAAKDPDLQVKILHVVPLPEVLTPAAAAGAPLTLPSRLDDYVQTRVQEILDQTTTALAIAADRIKTKHTIGVPAETILAEAKGMNADLIVMGRRGLSPLKELFLGSVSQEVLHKAQCPLILVP